MAQARRFPGDLEWTRNGSFCMKILSTLAFAAAALFAATFATAAPAKADNLGVYVGSNGFGIQVSNYGGYYDGYYGGYDRRCYNRWYYKRHRHCWRSGYSGNSYYYYNSYPRRHYYNYPRPRQHWNHNWNHRNHGWNDRHRGHRGWDRHRGNGKWDRHRGRRGHDGDRRRHRNY